MIRIHRIGGDVMARVSGPERSAGEVFLNTVRCTCWQKYQGRLVLRAAECGSPDSSVPGYWPSQLVCRSGSFNRSVRCCAAFLSVSEFYP